MIHAQNSLKKKKKTDNLYNIRIDVPYKLYYGVGNKSFPGTVE